MFSNTRFCLLKGILIQGMVIYTFLSWATFVKLQKNVTCLFSKLAWNNTKNNEVKVHSPNKTSNLDFRLILGLKRNHYCSDNSVPKIFGEVCSLMSLMAARAVSKTHHVRHTALNFADIVMRFFSCKIKNLKVSFCGNS